MGAYPGVGACPGHYGIMAFINEYYYACSCSLIHTCTHTIDSPSSMSPSQMLSHLSAVDLEKGSDHESGYVSLTLVSDSGTTDNMESTSVNMDHSGICRL